MQSVTDVSGKFQWDCYVLTRNAEVPLSVGLILLWPCCFKMFFGITRLWYSNPVLSWMPQERTDCANRETHTQPATVMMFLCLECHNWQGPLCRPYSHYFVMFCCWHACFRPKSLRRLPFLLFCSCELKLLSHVVEVTWIHNCGFCNILVNTGIKT